MNAIWILSIKYQSSLLSLVQRMNKDIFTDGEKWIFCPIFIVLKGNAPLLILLKYPPTLYMEKSMGEL